MTTLISPALAERMDPAFKAWVEATHVELDANQLPTPEQMRAGFAQMCAAVNNPTDSSLKVIDFSITTRDGADIKARLYQHPNRKSAAPVCVFLHGGGWVVGDLDTHSGVASDLAMQSHCDIVAVDYRLSPEHQYPVAQNDTEDALLYLREHAEQLNLDADRMGIIGDSAGASLAAGVALKARTNQEINLKLQVLIYPTLTDNTDAASYEENKAVPGLGDAELAYYFKAYMGGETAPSPYAAPLTVNNVEGLPPTFISVAELDRLRDDGIAYAEKLQKADVQAEVEVVPGVGHAYLWLRRSSEVAASAFANINTFISETI